MKILFTSDTHYGFTFKTDRILRKRLRQWPKNIDVLVHGGDWISHKQNQFQKVLRLFRTFYQKIPILTVRGNHDHWDAKATGYDRHALDHSKIFDQHRVLHLQESNFVYSKKKRYMFMGFDGWYGNPNPPSNDCSYMGAYTQGQGTHQYYSRRASQKLTLIRKQVDSAMLNNYKLILVSHFPPLPQPSYGSDDMSMNASPSFLSPMTYGFDLLLIGHSHRPMDKYVNDCRVVNAGGDYDSPAYKVIKI